MLELPKEGVMRDCATCEMMKHEIKFLAGMKQLTQIEALRKHEDKVHDGVWSKVEQPHGRRHS